MEQNEELLLESLLTSYNIKRRALLPLWIKIFIWIFMIMGGFAFLGILAGMSSLNFSVSLYGLESREPVSALGLFISFLFIFKGVVAFGLWTEMDWAVKLALVDAIIGIAVCCVVMLVLPNIETGSGFSFNIRLELILLIPFLIKLLRIKDQWG